MYKIDVDYPDEIAIEKQKQIIIEQVLEKPEGLMEKIKKIYYGPGFSVLFYQCSSVWVVGIMTYLFVLAGSIFLHPMLLYKEFLGLMSAPILYFAFSAISYWAEEEDAIIELKKTLKYSFSHLSTLRMFWVSIFSAVMNLFIFSLGAGLLENIWPMAIVGISGMFIFSMLSLYLYDTFGKKNHTLFIMGGWIGVCWILAGKGEGIHHILFQVIPLTAHIVIAVGCFLGLLVYVRKVGFKNAYA